MNWSIRNQLDLFSGIGINPGEGQGKTSPSLFCDEGDTISINFPLTNWSKNHFCRKRTAMHMCF